MRKNISSAVFLFTTCILLLCLSDCSGMAENTVKGNENGTKEITEDEAKTVYSDFFNLIMPEISVNTDSMRCVNRWLFGPGKMTASDVPDVVKQLLVWNIYNFHRGLEEIEPSEDIKEKMDDEEGCYIYPVSLFDERIKALFGPECTITHETFSDDAHTCVYDGDSDTYITYMYKKGCAEETVYAEYFGEPYSEMENYEQNGGELYFYTRFLMREIYISSHDENGNSIYKIKLYSDGTRSEESFITELDYDYVTDDLPEYASQLLDKYGSLYKTTFIRAEDGSYYWAGSEQLSKYDKAA